MAVIGIAVNEAKPEAVQATVDLVGLLRSGGHRVVADDAEVHLLGSFGLEVDRPGDATVPTLGEVDLMVALGGDGTVLRAVEQLGGSPVPVLGVNLGQLGYLTEVEPGDLAGALERFLGGDFAIERRMLLRVQLRRTDGSLAEDRLVLNEATIDREVHGHTIRLEVAIDGRPFTPYEVDALIAGTPTGSTAYGYSAGGPIVAPTHRVVLLTPVSPHMLFDRTLVLEPSSMIAVTVAGHRKAMLVCDGRVVCHLAPGDVVACTAATEEAMLVVLEPRDFPGLLKAKFKLSDR